MKFKKKHRLEPFNTLVYIKSRFSEREKEKKERDRERWGRGGGSDEKNRKHIHTRMALY